MKKVCVIFPYSMGKDFMSGGVTKLVIENLVVSSKKYETHVILPLNNDAFKAHLNGVLPNVSVHLVDFDYVAQFADTVNYVSRIVAIIKKAYRALSKSYNLLREIKDIAPDIVHLHAEVSYMFLKKIKREGYVTIFHTSSLRFAENIIIKNLVVKNAEKYANYIVSPTKSIDKLYSNKNRYILENPIVMSKPEKAEIMVDEQIINDSRIKIVFTGRICRVKQIHYLIEAIGSLPKDYEGRVATYIIGKPNNDGDEAYYKEIIEIIKTKNIRNIFFLGYKSNVSDYLRYADVGVLLSKSEAISMSCVEYMYSGLPVLGFDNPGINEVVIDGYNGYLVKDGDIEELKNRIQTCVNSKEKLLELKHNAKKYADEHFSAQVFEKRLIEIYEEVLNGK